MNEQSAPEEKIETATFWVDGEQVSVAATKHEPVVIDGWVF